MLVRKEQGGAGGGWCGWCGVRHLVIALLFLSTSIAYAARVSLSVAIVAMTAPANSTAYPVFEWNAAARDALLSSFFWGYIVLQIPAGVAAARWGGGPLLAASMLANGLLTALTPLAAAQGGWAGAAACRVATGLSQGLVYPSVHGVLGRWAPPAERGRMGTFVYAGSLVGTLVQLSLSGLLAARFGWPSIFYAAGGCSVLWVGAWAFAGASSPESSRLISAKERDYILAATGRELAPKRQRGGTPWRSIWTSLPFWSILLAHGGQSLGFWTLLTEMPSYMDKVLGVDIKSNGVLSALPYLAMYVASFAFSALADLVHNRGLLSLGASRRLFNSIAFWGPSASLLALSFAPPGHVPLAVALFATTMGLNGAHYVGFLISHIDIAPNYSSTLMGITNGLGNVFSIMAPLSVSLLVQDEHSASEWRKVFVCSASLYFLTNLFYLLFASGELQPWNDHGIEKSVEDKDAAKPKQTAVTETEKQAVT